MSLPTNLRFSGLSPLRGGSALQFLDKSMANDNGVLPIFWATCVFSPLFNIYMTTKLLLTTCYPYRKPSYKIPICSSATVMITVTLVFCMILACTHVKYFKQTPLPRVCCVGIDCCLPNYSRLRKAIQWMIRASILWELYLTVVTLAACLPLQLLLLATNTHLYGALILTVESAMILCILVLSIPFTIDQCFSKDRKYRLSLSRASCLALLYTLMSVAVLGIGSLAISVRFILQLSKHGEQTTSFGKSVAFLLRYLLLPFIVTIVRMVCEKVEFMGTKYREAKFKVPH